MPATPALPPVPAIPAAVRQTRSPLATESTRPRRILAVDDAPRVGTVLARLLSLRGHTVVPVTSSEAALDRLAAEPFDLVISDVRLGAGMSGWELAATVRRAYGDVRFVLMTGW